MSPHWTRAPSGPERDLRRQINLSLARALFDREYAEQLLADPTVVLDEHGCTPQQYLELRGIHAHNITDFACQAEALFWPAAEPPGRCARPALVAAR
jgi:hypothetical protein